MKKKKKPVRRARGALWLGRLAAALCGLLCVGLLAWTIGAAAEPRRSDDVMGIGIVFLMVVPMLSVPIGLACFVGALTAKGELKSGPCPDASAGLQLSLAAPIATLLIYLFCLTIVCSR